MADNNNNNRTDDTFDVQTTGTTDAVAPRYRGFFARNWPRFFLLCSIAVTVLTFLSIIFNFLDFIFSPAAVLLNIYCLVFSLLALSAELRQYRLLRKIVYTWLKYMYFLTYYKPRGIFYAFFGLLLLEDSIFMYVASAVAIAVGVLMIITSFACDLPVYEDPQEMARTQREFRKYQEEKYGYSTDPGMYGQADAATVADVAAQLQQLQQQGGGGGGKNSSVPVQDTPAMPAQQQRVAPPMAKNEVGRQQSLSGNQHNNASASVNFAEATGREYAEMPSRETSAAAAAASAVASVSFSPKEGPDDYSTEVPPTVAARDSSHDALRQQFMSAMGDAEKDEGLK